jgi:AcrR family transcriptional regulator
LLQEQGILDLRVVDISRDIGSSPATFYQYFNDVDEAILELSKEATEDEKPLVALLQPSWTESDGLERAGRFVDAYMVYWDTHHAVLRARNLKAEEGNRHFRAVRTEANLLVMDALQAMVTEGIATKRLPDSLDPFTTAAAVVAMCERLFAFQTEMARRGANRSAIRNTLATLLCSALTGH